MDNERSELQGKLDKFHQSANQLNMEIAKMREAENITARKYQHLEDEKQSLKVNFQKAEGEYARQTKLLQDERTFANNLRAENTKLKERRTALENEIQKYKEESRKEGDSLRKGISSIQRQLTCLKTAFSTVSQSEAGLKDLVDNMKEMQAKLLKHLKSKFVEMEDATRRSRTLIARNNDLESNNRDLARANNALHKKLASVQKAKGELEEKCDQCQGKCKQLEAELTSHREKISNSTEKFQLDIKMREQAEEQARLLQLSIVKKEEQLKEAEEINDHLKGNNEDLLRKLKESDVKYREMDSNLAVSALSIMEKEEELKKAKKSHDHLEDRLNECEHTNEDLQRQFKEKDARYGEMESNLAAAAVTVETLRRTNDKLLGAEEANRKTISDQVEDQKRQAHQIYLLKQEKSQCLTMLEETKVSLLESEEEFAKKAEECESRRMSEEQLNSKVACTL
jgi:chromosome segregation ATPase